MKVKANTITVINKAQIEKELMELEALLDGRIDIDNIHSTAQGTASIGKSSFADLADFASPIYSDKFFGSNTGDMALFPEHAVDFYEDIFQDLLLKGWNSDSYSIITKKATLTLNYKNQVNLEKPSVILAGDSGLTLEQQRLATSKYYKDKEKAYQEWLASYESPSIGSIIGSLFFGMFTGGTAGFAAGGPIGAAFGAVIGAAVGTVAGSGFYAYQQYNMPAYSEGSYDSHAANTQIVIFKHPPNYRMVSMTEVVDKLTELLGDKVRYVNDGNELNRRESELIPAMSLRVSCDNKLGNDIKSFDSYCGKPYEIDAETTAVAITIAPGDPSIDLIESEDDYITFLAEIDILFKEIT